MSVRFGSRAVGDGNPCFVTYEAGPTHSGLESAKKLVKLAADAGADAVKFQIIDPDRLVADRKLPFTYDVLVDRDTERTETVSEPLYDILCRRALSHGEWRELKKFSDGLGLAFFATIGFDDEIRLLEEIGCHSIKIASADVNHLPLIRKAARTGMCIQLDTGNASLGEVEIAVDAVMAEGNNSIVIHQCPTGYPAKRDGINLNIIRTLKQMFGLPVAYSDHTPGWEMDIAAIALGANMVEKTITEDRTTRSVEHIFSLEPADMARFVRIVRDVEAAMGLTRRILAPEEKKKRDNYRRSIFLAAPVRAGSRVADAKIEFRRPGHGYGPERYEELSGRIFRKDLPAGHMVALDDLS
jgi:N,N'-diacetyllegionaminate synthase